MDDSSKRVHFEQNGQNGQNNGNNGQNQIIHNSGSPCSPSTKSRMGLLASLKNTYNSKLMDQSSPVKSSAGILTKLHEKLAGTRSLGSPSPSNAHLNTANTGGIQNNHYNLQQNNHQNHQIILNNPQLMHEYNDFSGNNGLDVPKLRDLKSHSFPPPFSSNGSEIKSQHSICTVTTGYTGSGSSASVSASSTGGETTTSSFADIAPINSLTDSSNSPTSQDVAFETTDERRKRWQLLHNHSSAAFIPTR